MKIKLSAVSILCSSILVSSFNASFATPAVNDKTLEMLESNLDYFKAQKDNLRKDTRTLSDLNVSLPDENKIKQLQDENQSIVSKTHKDVTSVTVVGERIFDNESVNKLKKDGEAKLAALKKQQEQESKIIDTFDTLIFISYGMDEQTLRQLYTINAGNPRVAMVIRGLIKGTTTIEGTIRKLQNIAVELKLEVPPTVLINPVWFKQYHIDSVPTIVVLDGKTAKKSGDIETGKESSAVKELARVEGLIDPSFIFNEVENGKKGDLGIKGPVQEIAERDMIEEMQERASKINWNEKMQVAKERAWNNIPIEPLEHATKYKQRFIDSTVTVQQDIIVDNPKEKGKKLVIARKGDKVNPLEFRSFDRLLVVFNPTIKSEVEFVRKNIDAWRKEHRVLKDQIKLIITNINRDGGWKEYNDLVDTVGQHIYVLVPDIKNSFLLQKTPCLVYAQPNGLNFIVEEFNVDTKDGK